MITVDVIRLIILSLFGSGTNKFVRSEGSDVQYCQSLNCPFTKTQVRAQIKAAI